MEKTQSSPELAHDIFVRQLTEMAVHNPEVQRLPLTEAVVLLASQALTAVAEQYGTGAEAPGVMDGTLEKGTPTTHHGLVHTKSDMRHVVLYAQKWREAEGVDVFSDEDVLITLLAAAWHDYFQGNGRGKDEELSARALATAMYEYNKDGFTFSYDQICKAYDTIIATRWNPVERRQDLDPSGIAAKTGRALVVADMLHMCLPQGPVDGIKYGVEAIALQQEKYGAYLLPVMESRGLDPAGMSLFDYLDLIDSDEVLRGVFGSYLRDQVGFYKSYAFADARIDSWFPLRSESTQFWRVLSQRYDKGEVTARQCYEQAEYYKQYFELAA